MTDAIAAMARLMILRELALQVDARSNDTMLAQIVEAQGIRRSREWLRTQLHAIAELGAVTLTEIGEVLVVELRRAGRDHVERRSKLVGIAPPADAD